MDDVTTLRPMHAANRGAKHCNRFAYFGTVGKPNSAGPPQATPARGAAVCLGQRSLHTPRLSSSLVEMELKC